MIKIKGEPVKPSKKLMSVKSDTALGRRMFLIVERLRNKRTINRPRSFVEIVCRDNHRRFAHRSALECCSPTLERILTDPAKELISIQLDIQLRVLDQILRFFYDNEIEISDQYLIETYAAAKLLQCGDLARKIRESLTTTDFATFLEDEGCFDKVPDRDLVHLYELIYHLRLSSDELTLLRSRLDRWSTMGENREEFLSRFFGLLSNEATQTLNGTPFTIDRTDSPFSETVFCMNSNLEIFKICASGLVRIEDMKITDPSFKPNDESIIRHNRVFRLNCNGQIEVTDINPKNPQTSRGHFKGNHKEYTFLAASRDAIYASDFGTVYSLDYINGEIVKNTVVHSKNHDISVDFYYMDGEHGLLPRFALHRRYSNRMDFFYENGTKMEVNFPLGERKIHAVSQDYMVTSEDGYVDVRCHDARDVYQTMRLKIEGEIEKVIIDVDVIFLKRISNDGTNDICVLQGTKTPVFLALESSSPLWFIRII